MEPKDQKQNQDDQNNLSSQDTTQQTQNQQDQRTDDNNDNDFDPNERIAYLESRIAEQQISNRKLEGLLERLASNNNNNNDQPPPPRNIEADRNRFYGDPIGILEERDAKLLKHMERMIEPLKEVATSFRATSEYDRLKMHVKHDPLFGKGLKDPDIEAAVDMIMKQGNVEPTEENIKSAIAQAAGMKMMGAIGGGNNNRRINDNNNNARIDPPHVQASRTRTDAPPPPMKELTEEDRLAMRYANLNPNNPKDVEEYWALTSPETMVLSTHKTKGDK